MARELEKSTQCQASDLGVSTHVGPDCSSPQEPKCPPIAHKPRAGGQEHTQTQTRPLLGEPGKDPCLEGQAGAGQLKPGSLGPQVNSLS